MKEELEHKKIAIVSLGSDPEFLIIDNSTNKYVSSLGLIPGDKDSPEPLKELGDGYSIQKDNVLAELCIPPAKSGDELFEFIQKGIEYVNKNILPDNLKLATITGGEFSDGDLNNEYARTFGCSPSYNAWTYSMNEPGDNDSNYRGAGCHIHVGYENVSLDNNIKISRVFDLFAGVPSVLLDNDKIRRQQYGQAGEFRPTRYGIELRILGGYLLSDKKYFDSAIKGLYKTFDFINDGKELTDEQQLKIQACINGNDTELAMELVKEFQMEELVEDALVLS